MSVKTVNHNNPDPTLQKHARRRLLVRVASRHLVEPTDVFLFPGMLGQDAALIRQTWPTVPILGIERSDVVLDQMDMTVFGGPGMEFYGYHFTPFLAQTGKEPAPLRVVSDSGKIVPNFTHGRAMTTRPIACADGGTIKKPCPVSDEVARAMNFRRFDLAYLDFVKTCDDETIQNLRDFLGNRVQERFVIAIANSPPRRTSQRNRFGEYEAVAKSFGAAMHRRDYKDSSAMNFAILVR